MCIQDVTFATTIIKINVSEGISLICALQCPADLKRCAVHSPLSGMLCESKADIKSYLIVKHMLPFSNEPTNNNSAS